MTPTAVPISAVLPAIPAIAPWPSIINVSSPPRRCRAPTPLPSDWRTVTPAPPHPHTTKAYPKPRKKKVETPASSLSRHSLSPNTQQRIPLPQKQRPRRQHGKKGSKARIRGTARARVLKDATQASKRYRFYGLHHPTARICDQARSSIRHVPRRHLVVESSVHIPEFRNRSQLSCCILYREYLTLRSVWVKWNFCKNMT